MASIQAAGSAAVASTVGAVQQKSNQQAVEGHAISRLPKLARVATSQQHISRPLSVSKPTPVTSRPLQHRRRTITAAKPVHEAEPVQKQPEEELLQGLVSQLGISEQQAKGLAGAVLGSIDELLASNHGNNTSAAFGSQIPELNHWKDVAGDILSGSSKRSSKGGNSWEDIAQDVLKGNNHKHSESSLSGVALDLLKKALGGGSHDSHHEEEHHRNPLDAAGDVLLGGSKSKGGPRGTDWKGDSTKESHHHEGGGLEHVLGTILGSGGATMGAATLGLKAIAEVLHRLGIDAGKSDVVIFLVSKYLKSRVDSQLLKKVLEAAPVVALVLKGRNWGLLGGAKNLIRGLGNLLANV